MIRVYIGVAIAAAIAAAVAGAWFKGREHERDLQIGAQLRAEVVVGQRQRRETIREVIKYVHVKTQHQAALPDLQRRIADACTRGLLSARAQVRAVTDRARMPGDGPRAVAGTPAAADGADRAWCAQLASDYAAGVGNTDALGLALGWIRANGGAPE